MVSVEQEQRNRRYVRAIFDYFSRGVLDSSELSNDMYDLMVGHDGLCRTTRHNILSHIVDGDVDDVVDLVNCASRYHKRMYNLP